MSFTSIAPGRGNPKDSDASRMPKTFHKFDVLYYKRKNKVHKTKGVSKIDGCLTVEPPPSSMISLTDNESVIFRGIQPEIAHRVVEDTGLQVDDVIVVGAYEVQIISTRNDDMYASNYHPGKSILQVRKKPSTSTGGFHEGSDAFCPKIQGTEAAQSNSQSSLSLRKSSSATRSPLKSVNGNSTTHDKDSFNDGDGPHVKVTNQPRLLPLKRPLHPSTTSSRKLLPAFRPPCRKISPLPQLTNGRDANTEVAIGDSSSALRTLEILDLPNSIRTNLLPHQVEGVTFLWKCLTGQSKAAFVSPYATSDKPYTGAILAGKINIQFRVSIHSLCSPRSSLAKFIYKDSMGMGKTLMTIAVICSMYRKKRDTVSTNG